MFVIVGYLIIQGAVHGGFALAGGRVTSLDGGPFDLRTGRILASNGLIHEDMRRVVQTFYGA